MFCLSVFVSLCFFVLLSVCVSVCLLRGARRSHAPCIAQRNSRIRGLFGVLVGSVGFSFRGRGKDSIGELHIHSGATGRGRPLDPARVPSVSLDFHGPSLVLLGFLCIFDDLLGFQSLCSSTIAHLSRVFQSLCFSVLFLLTVA